MHAPFTITPDAGEKKNKTHGFITASSRDLLWGYWILVFFLAQPNNARATIVTPRGAGRAVGASSSPLRCG